MTRMLMVTVACLSLMVAVSSPTRVLGQAQTAAPVQQNLERPNLPNPYRTIADFVTMPEGRQMGSTNAINVDAKGSIWVFERCGANSCADSTVDPILQFDRSGKLLQSFGAGKFVFPHAIEFDRDGNLWIVDAGVVDGKKGSQIFSHSPDGKVLLELGKPGVRGTTPDLFNEPSDIAIAPNGDLYVADGHISPQSNRRIVHLTRDGKFIEAWGRPGTGPGESTIRTHSPSTRPGASLSATAPTTASRSCPLVASSSPNGGSSGVRAVSGFTTTSCMSPIRSRAQRRGSTATTPGSIGGFTSGV